MDKSLENSELETHWNAHKARVQSHLKKIVSQSNTTGDIAYLVHITREKLQTHPEKWQSLKEDPTQIEAYFCQVASQQREYEEVLWRAWEQSESDSEHYLIQLARQFGNALEAAEKALLMQAAYRTFRNRLFANRQEWEQFQHNLPPLSSSLREILSSVYQTAQEVKEAWPEQQPHVEKYLATLSRNTPLEDEAEELVFQVYLQFYAYCLVHTKLWNRLMSAPKELERYLIKVALFAFRDLYRRKNTRREVSLQALHSIGTQLPSSDHTTDPVRVVIDGCTNAALRSYIQQLPSDQRIVVILRLNGVSNKDIAIERNCTAVHASRLYERAARTLRKCFESSLTDQRNEK